MQMTASAQRRVRASAEIKDSKIPLDQGSKRDKDKAQITRGVRQLKIAVFLDLFGSTSTRESVAGTSLTQKNAC